VQHALVTLNPFGHSVGQRFIVPPAVLGDERLHSSTYNRAGVFLFHDFSKNITLLRSSGAIPAQRSLHSAMVERPP
jgi:hypothetical protein